MKASKFKKGNRELTRMDAAAEAVRQKRMVAPTDGIVAEQCLREATERMDVQIIEVWIELDKPLAVPLGSEMDMEIKRD